MEPPVHSPLLSAPLAYGDPQQLPPQVLSWLQECVSLCNPKQVPLVVITNLNDQQEAMIFRCI